MPTTKKEPPKLVNGVRRSMELSCTLCKRTISVMAFEDSEQADGWPLHRCGREVRPFNKSTVL